MNYKNNNFEVALTKELCPVCLKEQNGAIIINSILDKKEAAKVKKLHNQVTGFSKDVCNECKLKLKENYMYFIGIDASQTTDKQNPYRNGIIFQANRNIIKGSNNFANVHVSYLEMTDEQVKSFKKQFKCHI